MDGEQEDYIKCQTAWYNVHMQDSKLFKCLECAMLYVISCKEPLKSLDKSGV